MPDLCSNFTCYGAPTRHPRALTAQALCLLLLSTGTLLGDVHAAGGCWPRTWSPTQVVLGTLPAAGRPPQPQLLTVFAVLPAKPERALAEIRAPPAHAGAPVLTPGPITEVPLSSTAWKQSTWCGLGAEIRADRDTGSVTAAYH